MGIVTTTQSERRVGVFLGKVFAWSLLFLFLGSYLDCISRCNFWLEQKKECQATQGLLGQCGKDLERSRPMMCGTLAPSP